MIFKNYLKRERKMTKKPLSFEELLQGCENEKLHLSGQIQSFGALLVVDKKSLEITYASTNFVEFGGIEAKKALGVKIDSLGWNITSAISAAIKNGKIGNISTMIGGLKLPNGVYDVALSSNGAELIIEIEKRIENPHTIQMHAVQVDLLNIPTTKEEFQEYQYILAEKIQTIVGFERVMVYKFHKDWSGEVVAEALTGDTGSYMGLRFPSSDIPAIARSIYMNNSYRLISDVGDKPCDIISLSDAIPDLTYSDLRSVSPIHIEYLKNMGVKASFSIPIKVKGALWGLVACHHGSPKYISLENRNNSAVLVHSFAIGLAAYQASVRVKIIDSIDKKIDSLLSLVMQEANILDGIQKHADKLTNILDSVGIAAAIDSEVILIGQTPNVKIVSMIDEWFLQQYEDLILDTYSLSSLLNIDSSGMNGICGVLGIKIKSFKSGLARFYWFRAEEIQEVNWAGNPNKPTAEDPNATTLSPRKSFEKWTQIMSGMCHPWSGEDKMIVGKFRSQVLRWL